MAISKFLDPKNDFAFKRIFGNERNKDILIHFINDMILFKGQSSIVEVTFLKPNQDPEVQYKKQSILDVLCQDEQGNQYIVEMQVAEVQGFEKRAQYYAAKTYSSQANRGEKYENLREVIFLAITDFVMFPNKQAYKSDHIILDRASHQHDLKDFSFTFLELPKFNKPIDQLQTMVEKWAYFFKYASQTSAADLDHFLSSSAVIKRAYEQLDQFYWAPADLDAYEQEQKRLRDNQAAERHLLMKGQEQGLAQGLVQGKAEGLVQGKAEGLVQGKAEGLVQGKAEGKAEGLVEGKAEAIRETARNLLSHGVEHKVVQVSTGLSLEELEQLQKDLK